MIGEENDQPDRIRSCGAKLLALEKLQAWLTAFEQAMNYDPQENTDTIIRHFRDEVAQLETRVIELEGRNQRILASLVKMLSLGGSPTDTPEIPRRR